MLVGVVVLLGGCNYHHEKVPSGANPAHFKQLAAWDSCGASGEYCSQVIIFGSDEIPFEDAIDDIETRYLRKGWAVDRLDEGSFPNEPGIVMSNQERDECVLLRRFDVKNYTRDLSKDAPTGERMTELVAPYSTLILASAGCG